MDKFLKKQLKEWILTTIKQNPKKYGGDTSNVEIRKAYIDEMFQGQNIESLTVDAYSRASTVSRMKNLILKTYPEYDFRRKYKPKKQKLSATEKTLFEGLYE